MICEVWSVARGPAGKSTRAREERTEREEGRGDDRRVGGRLGGTCKQKETIGGMIVG